MSHHELTSHEPSEPSDELLVAMRGVTADAYGRTIVTGETRSRIVGILHRLGIAGEEQAGESIDRGIADARWLVETSNAAQSLRDHPFVDESQFHDYLVGEYPTVSVDFSEADVITVDWSKIAGAATFDSWQGRGVNGSGEVDSASSSLDKILNFATRDTKLPPIELLVVLTSDGPIPIAGNSHRAAAAILRNENIDCNYLKIIDAREET